MGITTLPSPVFSPIIKAINATAIVMPEISA
jgi:hypothetical protein